uniref:Ribosomal protein L20 n=1 Tax=Polyopes lancifolius TaxID=194517 RepID=A0A891T479_9FLOR|nr:ribosomal protein L20 [Polyopes lancifolius]QRM91076.1 ribosomal protein L20 [Polyopes lancifolius]
MKREIFQTRSRKIKKRSRQRQTTTQINLLGCLKYNLFRYFLRKEKLWLNKKLLSKIFANEIGTLFSFKQWMTIFYNI